MVLLTAVDTETRFSRFLIMIESLDTVILEVGDLKWKAQLLDNEDRSTIHNTGAVLEG